MFGVSHRLDKQRMKRAESDGGRYLNSNIGISFLFRFFGCLKVSTILKSKRVGKKVTKTHFTPHGSDSGTCQVQFWPHD